MSNVVENANNVNNLLYIRCCYFKRHKPEEWNGTETTRRTQCAPG